MYIYSSIDSWESPVLLAAVVPGSEDDSSGSEEGGDPSADPVIVPQVPDIKTGRVIERTLGDHRLWRMALFNFEKYPGMRMNVPPERMTWTDTVTLFLANEDFTAVNEDGRCDGHFVRIPLLHRHCTYLSSIHYNTLCMLCENTINITDIIP
ncbi:unnamed protein product [Schistosoma bovis]|nr:unnamed protein product [Schistosoma bovis]